MKTVEHRTQRRSTLAKVILALIGAFLLGGMPAGYFVKTAPSQDTQQQTLPPQNDAALVRSLLNENLSGRDFDFALLSPSH